MLPPVADEVIASPTLLARADEVKRLSIRRLICKKRASSTVAIGFAAMIYAPQIEALANSTLGVRRIGHLQNVSPYGALAAAVGLPKARPQGTALINSTSL
jgi:hypothetical protein